MNTKKMKPHHRKLAKRKKRRAIKVELASMTRPERQGMHKAFEDKKTVMAYLRDLRQKRKAASEATPAAAAPAT
jgi:predicted RNA-binding protein Jag